MIPILMQLGHTAPHPLPPSNRPARTYNLYSMAELKVAALECLACGRATQDEVRNWLGCNSSTAGRVINALVRDGAAREVAFVSCGRAARAWEIVEQPAQERQP